MIPVHKTGTPRDSSLTPITIMVVDTMGLKKSRSLLNRIQGKSMLKNKSSQIARDYMSSYVGYIRDERIIAHVIVERVSGLKGRRESS